MKKLFLLFALLAVAGCAHPEYRAYKAGVPDAQFRIDNYECMQQSSTPYGGGGTGSIGITMILISKHRAETQSAMLYKACMEARGYTVTEVQPSPQPIQPVQGIR